MKLFFHAIHFAAASLLAGHAAPLMLQPGQVLQADGGLLKPGTQAIPCMADWNGDGLSDLFLGYQPAFKVALYMNTGTVSQPAFSGFTNVQAGGSDIYMPASGCGSPAPFVCDYNNDGKRDLLVGAGNTGKVWFYANTKSDSHPILASGVALLLGESDLSVGMRATPYVHDWDEDGLPDLLCGDADGYVHFFRNFGTRTAPIYTNDVLLEADGQILTFGYRSTVRVLDWDSDGIKDIVGSGSYNLAWCRNTGSQSTPRLGSPIRLQAPAINAGLANVDTGYRMRLEVIDWNHDGCCDLLIGNWDGCTYLYESYSLVLAFASSSDDKAILTWNSAPYLTYTVLTGTNAHQVTNQVEAGVASQGKSTCWTNAFSSSAARQFFRIGLKQ